MCGSIPALTRKRVLFSNEIFLLAVRRDLCDVDCSGIYQIFDVALSSIDMFTARQLLRGSPSNLFLGTRTVMILKRAFFAEFITHLEPFKFTRYCVRRLIWSNTQPPCGLMILIFGDSSS